VAALVADAVWLPSLAAATVLLLVLFPDGRLLSARWRWFVWLFAIDLVIYATATLVNPDPLFYFPDQTNPWGLEGAGAAPGRIVNVTLVVLFVALLVGFVALTQRFRRARGVERLQMKWLFYAAAVWLVVTPGVVVIGESGSGRDADVRVGLLVFSLLLVLIPLAVGIAILRYHLYDIDLVINRTLVYGSLTAILAMAYLGMVLVLQVALSPLTEQSDLAVAGSTLAVAALVRPLRARIQTVVDQRFYRARYDAARTLEAFGIRLRDELDLEALGADLRRVVTDTMQPTHVSLWLRSPS
jgi:hypothetical protein